MEISEEQLSNMSPEEIAALQKQNCIFCHIIANRVASRKIFEDDKTLAIMDINPANPGHILIMPKEHYQIMPQVPEEEIGHIMMVAKAISHVCLRVLKVKGTNIFIANGAIAGQKASHFMLHVIPRTENDGISSFDLPEKQANPHELDEISKLLLQKISELSGIKIQDLLGNKTEEQSKGQNINPEKKAHAKPEPSPPKKENPQEEEPEESQASNGKKNPKSKPEQPHSKKENPIEEEPEESQEDQINLDDISKALLGR